MFKSFTNKTKEKLPEGIKYEYTSFFVNDNQETNSYQTPDQLTNNSQNEKKQSSQMYNENQIQDQQNKVQQDLNSFQINNNIVEKEISDSKLQTQTNIWGTKNQHQNLNNSNCNDSDINNNLLQQNQTLNSEKKSSAYSFIKKKKQQQQENDIKQNQSQSESVQNQQIQQQQQFNLLDEDESLQNTQNNQNLNNQQIQTKIQNDNQSQINNQPQKKEKFISKFKTKKVQNQEKQSQIQNQENLTNINNEKIKNNNSNSNRNEIQNENQLENENQLQKNSLNLFQETQIDEIDTCLLLPQELEKAKIETKLINDLCQEGGIRLKPKDEEISNFLSQISQKSPQIIGSLIIFKILENNSYKTKAKALFLVQELCIKENAKTDENKNETNNININEKLSYIKFFQAHLNSIKTIQQPLIDDKASNQALQVFQEVISLLENPDLLSELQKQKKMQNIYNPIFQQEENLLGDYDEKKNEKYGIPSSDQPIALSNSQNLDDFKKKGKFNFQKKKVKKESQIQEKNQQNQEQNLDLQFQNNEQLGSSNILSLNKKNSDKNKKASSEHLLDSDILESKKSIDSEKILQVYDQLNQQQQQQKQQMQNNFNHKNNNNLPQQNFYPLNYQQQNNNSTHINQNQNYNINNNSQQQYLPKQNSGYSVYQLFDKKNKNLVDAFKLEEIPKQEKKKDESAFDFIEF
ncbi:hypothetical protein PPERSA_11060 [Pseudocohnilembus persalinus]|uniref:Uncharacterized protein n=1 Tax=Pseudocohnilembus persalinus TaxID=266149 RepID=A0A0V0QYY7_PSEPJ|nr:hypothetical protein PPERSA_11060 [Pseudocohnilembus persalinus]|eukprot:KRX07511.1 hypothetical protein PPERSA_11060 [Pseudocohnilembus persalinus]